MARSGGSRTRMKKPCDCCKRYLDHLEQKNQSLSCFLGHMTANFKHSMVVPNRFAKQFGGRLSGTIKLESPNGNLYDVEVSEHLNKLMLGHGWEAFVDANHIEENDFLIFRHIEKSHFEVMIFDTDGCEKVFSCAGLRNTPCVQERSVDSVGISSSSCHDTTESSGSERFARSEKSGSSNHGKTENMATTSSSSEESGEHVSWKSDMEETSDGSPNSKDSGGPAEPSYILPGMSGLSRSQKKIIEAKVRAIKSEVPIYIAIMRKTNAAVSKLMHRNHCFGLRAVHVIGC
ncbi:hypothetical protein BDA96_01G174100 [Sorghum bicolor]|uniref:TF-B3 domain-containing protein n=1 Tax=Sorghum bicolor TaxID=4558 RepID=A0A921RZD8_SORBI|nr:hypothetical protein BDA96_01G174100 [Sorghum bicolor]